MNNQQTSQTLEATSSLKIHLFFSIQMLSHVKSDNYEGSHKVSADSDPLIYKLKAIQTLLCMC